MMATRSQREIARERLESLVSVLPKRRAVVALAFRQGDDLMGEVELADANDPLGALADSMCRWATVQGRRCDLALVGMNATGEVVWRGSLPVRPDEEEGAVATAGDATLTELVRVMVNANLALIKQNVETLNAVATVFKAQGNATTSLIQTMTEQLQAQSARASSEAERADGAQSMVKEALEAAELAASQAEKSKQELDGIVGSAMKELVGGLTGAVVAQMAPGAGGGT